MLKIATFPIFLSFALVKYDFTPDLPLSNCTRVLKRSAIFDKFTKNLLVILKKALGAAPLVNLLILWFMSAEELAHMFLLCLSAKLLDISIDLLAGLLVKLI